MKEKIKKELINYGILALIAGGLYLTGLHLPLISTLQRGILATGLLRPDTEEVTAAAELPIVDLDIQLIDAHGKAVNLEQFRGQVLFINLWATWCPPCLAEMPNIDGLYRELEEEGDIAFIMLSTDRDFSKAVTHVANKGYGFPIYRMAGRWPSVLQSSTLPTTFVIDREGRLVVQHRGMAQYNSLDFRAFLRGLL